MQLRSATCTATLGNSFGKYYQRYVEKPVYVKLDPMKSALLRAVEEGRIMELSIGDHDLRGTSAFNDTSLQLFPPARCDLDSMTLKSGLAVQPQGCTPANLQRAAFEIKQCGLIFSFALSAVLLLAGHDTDRIKEVAPDRCFIDMQV